MSRLKAHPLGAYHFLPGIAPYSCGVVAREGHEMVRVILERPVSWREGFARVDRFLQERGRGRTDLCAMELRSPSPFTMDGFIEFNRGYCAVLEDWNVFVDGINPIARTNVCPVGAELSEPVLHGFSYVRSNPDCSNRTFIVAGAGELREGTLVREGIVRRGETSIEAMKEKARYVCEVMGDRMNGLEAPWMGVSSVNVYTVHPIDPLADLLWDELPAARGRGICWQRARPPVMDIEFEMDLHGVLTQEMLRLSDEQDGRKSEASMPLGSAGDSRRFETPGNPKR